MEEGMKGHCRNGGRVSGTQKDEGKGRRTLQGWRHGGKDRDTLAQYRRKVFRQVSEIDRNTTDNDGEMGTRGDGRGYE